MHPSVYRGVIQFFLDDKMSAEEFRIVYFAAMKQEKSIWVEPLHNILQRMFSSLDAYWEECTLEEEDELTITEVTLRKEATEAVAKFDEFWRNHKGSYLLEREAPEKHYAQV